MTQHEKADFLQRLQQQGHSLLLPNAWDAASARLFEEAGFQAIGTTSAGIAFSQGYSDGQAISRDEMMRVIARIVEVVRVPVTADIEAGYGPTPKDVAETIRAVIATGAVGINLEDNRGVSQLLYTLDEQVERIAAARKAADDASLALVINARIDTYLYQVGEEATRMEETIQRAKAYLQAGADSIFVPGVIDPEYIQILVREIPAPLNIMASPGAPSTRELFALGVNRVSIGGAAMLATMGLVRDIAHELHEEGTYQQISTHSYDFAIASQLFQQEK
ncbi:isocitrate lyase/PEP mutase family protein [Ktedonospora formicarum]|uniref:2-methylisocitrate lyase n=1 Tax=Ktedonospora formicarum TaxID=2778364 RepID=A0A8J3I3R9_9CHLR|nr:isocitrate lyase/phosphoenolpyruvate mutase family protein [Ktedonospora formicarum]GHO46253.1 2-methylisocitrate lyase [Ktedonospora formicarum]